MLTLRPLFILLAALPAAQDPAPADWIPAEALLVAEMRAPADAVTHILDSEPWQRFWNGPLGEKAYSSTEFQAMLQGLKFLGNMAGAEPVEMLDALTGGGVVFALLPGAPDPVPVLVVQALDAELAQDGINTLLRWATGGKLQVDGERWRVPVGNGVIARRDFWFFAAPDGKHLDALMQRTERPVTQVKGFLDARRELSGTELMIWVGKPLLDFARSQQPDERMPDIGQSLFFGGLAAVYRQADWLAAGIKIGEWEFSAEAVGPADAEALRKSHPVFFPAVRTVSLPKVPGFLGGMLFSRDLGPWWTSRDLYLSEKAMADSVEPDGNFSLLFQRDFGPEVLHLLEPEMRVLAARAPFESSAPDIEYPAGALGLRIKAKHREELADGFSSAFLATVSFLNFGGNAMPDTALKMDIERLQDGSKLIRSWYREFAGAGVVPPRYNLSPGLLLRPDGDVWISSSTPLLRAIAAAPAESVRLRGDRIILRMEAGRRILRADRGVLVAQRALQEGGDMDAANAWVDQLFAGMEILDQIELDGVLDGGHYRLVLSGRCDSPSEGHGR